MEIFIAHRPYFKGRCLLLSCLSGKTTEVCVPFTERGKTWFNFDTLPIIAVI